MGNCFQSFRCSQHAPFHCKRWKASRECCTIQSNQGSLIHFKVWFIVLGDCLFLQRLDKQNFENFGRTAWSIMLSKSLNCSMPLDYLQDGTTKTWHHLNTSSLDEGRSKDPKANKTVQVKCTHIWLLHHLILLNAFVVCAPLESHDEYTFEGRFHKRRIFHCECFGGTAGCLSLCTHVHKWRRHRVSHRCESVCDWPGHPSLWKSIHKFRKQMAVRPYESCDVSSL